MTLYADLLLQDIADPDAQTLSDAFPDENSSLFIEGMESVAHVLSITRKVETFGLPTSAPWNRIWAEMVGKPDVDTAFMDAICIYETPLREAIKRVISKRGLAHIAAQNKSRAHAPKYIKSHEILQYIQMKGHSLRLNLCRGIEDNGRIMSNGDFSKIKNEMRNLQVRGMDFVQDVITETAYDNAYHPVRDYLNSLKFEGGDPIGKLCTHFTTDYGMFPVFLRKWLIGACAKAMKAEENRMLVLDGPQGIGKSHFVLWLGSPLPSYHIEQELDTHNEDNIRRLAEYWIWEVKELGSSMRKSDWESMKGFLTQRTVKFRRKYDRIDTEQDALASFIGTINNEEGFMPTADRRYYVERVTAIDWAYTQIDIHQVWAQAMSLYLAGENWQPTSDYEREQIAAINEEYRVLDPVEETVKKWFKIDPKNQNWWLPSMEIMDTLKDPQKGNLKVGAEIDARKLARALTKLGLDKAKPRRGSGNQLRGYYGIDNKP